MVRRAPLFLWHLPRRFLMMIIRGYQMSLSPDHSPLKALYPYGYCRHEPTCSQYAIETLEKRGVLVGVPLAIWRILRCNPFVKPSEARMRKLAEQMIDDHHS